MDNQMPALFQINPSSGIPIYRQIMEQIIRLVTSNFLKPGDELPSVRQSAGYLEVNPMTISKAYSMLEAAGVLERVRGIGMIIAHNQKGAIDIEKRLELIQPALIEVANQSKQLAIPKEKILETLSEILEKYT